MDIVVGKYMDFDKYIKEIDNSIDFYSNSLNNINGLLLTNKEINILDSYNIIYNNCINLKEVISLVENKLDEFDYPEDLLEISDTLSERDYYMNTNK